jgi:hypothetical protein
MVLVFCNEDFQREVLISFECRGGLPTPSAFFRIRGTVFSAFLMPLLFSDMDFSETFSSSSGAGREFVDLVDVDS